MQDVMQVIRARRSVRTFDGKGLTAEDRHVLAEILDDTGNPFGIPVMFSFLDAAKHDLKSPAIVGERYYVAAKVPRVSHCEIAFGYEFERFCLEAASVGLGTVMLAASLNRDAFERAIAVGPDEVMPVASPVGREAARQSVREKAMRKALSADKRLPFGELFFNGSFDRPLDQTDAEPFLDALEAVRLAPSAANKQPWRVVVDGPIVYFYEAQSMRESPLGDVQKVDMGIALAHFDLVLSEAGAKGAFAFADPGIVVPAGVHYITTYELQER